MAGNVHDLDPTQLHLLRLIAAGNSGTGLADQFGCSLSSLAQQLAGIRRVLGVDSTSRALEVVRAAGCLG